MTRRFVAVFAVSLFLANSCSLSAQEVKQSTDELLPRVSLGIGVEDMPNDGPHGGVVVRHLAENGAAAKGGIQKGDIIVNVANRPVDDFDDFVAAIAGHRAGEKVAIVLLRDEEAKRLRITLGEPTKGDAPAADGCKSCAFLGAVTVPVHAIDDDTAFRLGLVGDRGLVVMDVVPGSPAAHAGLRHGDVIHKINSKDVADPDGLRNHVHRTGVGQQVKLDVVRGEQTRQIQATLAKGPCDIQLVLPREPAGTGDTAPAVQQLEERIKKLEQRIKRLETAK